MHPRAMFEGSNPRCLLIAMGYYRSTFNGTPFEAVEYRVRSISLYLVLCCL